MLSSKYLVSFLLSSLFFGSLFPSKVDAGTVMRLSGDFKGKGGTQEATIEDLGQGKIKISVDQTSWFESDKDQFNFSKTHGKCLTGHFAGNRTTDIACIYDYGDFNVGFIVFTSMGRSFNIGQWWISGAKNLNPDMIGEMRAGDFAQTGADGIKFSYQYPKALGYITFSSNRSKFELWKREVTPQQ